MLICWFTSKIISLCVKHLYIFCALRTHHWSSLCKLFKAQRAYVFIIYFWLCANAYMKARAISCLEFTPFAFPPTKQIFSSSVYFSSSFLSFTYIYIYILVSRKKALYFLYSHSSNSRQFISIIICWRFFYILHKFMRDIFYCI